MSATMHLEAGEFRFSGTSVTRDQPEKEWAHRLATREHLAYLRSVNEFDVAGPKWAKKTDSNGEIAYGHAYTAKDGSFSLLTIRLRTRDNKLNLTHNEDGTFDRFLTDSPAPDPVYSITSSNNGLESTHTLPALTVGLTSVAIIVGCLAMTVALASAGAAAEAAIAAGTAVATFCSVNVTVFPAVGIAIAVLALVGVWIAWAMGREIVLNLTYENRSKQTFMLVDHAVYNIGDNKYQFPATLKPFFSEGGFEFYSDVVINIDNYSKYRGVGISLKFQKGDGSFLIICLRNDIYKSGSYTIKQYPKGDQTTAQNGYEQCTGGVNKADFADFKWGNDLVVKNRLDADGFEQYNLAGILSFHDPA